jgi:hypothetical protein
VSNLEPDPAETTCTPTAVAQREREVLTPREVPLGGPRAMLVRRTLPHRDRRMVGAWCFVDHYGEVDLTGQPGMQVPPHPHTGLQTVSWLLAGEVLHQDSLGYEQLIRPGQLNLMTAGHGIAHAETTPPSPQRATQTLHGIQLWVALPSTAAGTTPRFEHHAVLPSLRDGDLGVTVVAGALAGSAAHEASPATTFTPLVGAELVLAAGAAQRLPLEPDFEHAVLAIDDGLAVDGAAVPRGSLTYLGWGRHDVPLAAATAPVRALLIGGEPFAEQIVMWWNFVGRSHEEVVAARAAWEADAAAAHPRFGAVRGWVDGRLPAPALPTTTLRPRGRVRGDA